KWGYINKNGELVISLQFAVDRYLPAFPEYRFSEGLCEIRLDHKMGYINTEGKVVINPRFNLALGFSEELAAVQFDNGKWGYINRAGQIAFNTPFKIAEGGGITDNPQYDEALSVS